MTGLSKTLSRMIAYWKNCLIDANKTNAPKENDCIKITSPLVDNKLPEDAVKQLFSGSKDKKDETFIDVLYAPISARYQNGSYTEIIAPIWVEMTLTLEGELFTGEKCYPILSPNYFEGYVTDKFTFGFTRENYNKTIKNTDPIPEEADLEEIHNYLVKLFKALNTNFDQLEFSESCTKLDVGLIRKDDSTKGINGNLIEILDTIKKEKITPSLFVNFEQENIPKNTVNPQQCQPLHIGHISHKNGLNDGQRESLYAVSSAKEGDIIGITGPPGTGKTTLLTNIIASRWVNAAINGEEPPKILVTSHNKQAVLNALNSFNHAGKIPNKTEIIPSLSAEQCLHLSHHWIEGIDSYGTLLASNDVDQSKFDKQGFQTLQRLKNYKKNTPPWKGWLLEFEHEEALEKHERHYLQQAKEAYPSQNFKTTKRIVEHLNSQLKFLQKELISLQKDRDLYLRHQKGSAQDIEKELVEIVAIQHKLDEKIKGYTERHNTIRANDKAFTAIQDEIIALLLPQTSLQKVFHCFTFIRKKRSANVIKKLKELKKYPRNWKEDALLSKQSLQTLFSAIHNDYLEKLDTQEQNISNTKNQYNSYTIQAKELRKLLKDLNEISNKWQTNLKVLIHDNPDLVEKYMKNPQESEALFDTTYRVMMFNLAARYWEGRWILDLHEASKSSDRNQKLYGQGEKSLARFFHRLGKLTPCLGTHIHGLKRNFEYSTPPKNNKNKGFKESILFDFLDMIIIDEAGQVPPEKGLAAITLAKKAVLIGDENQLEPIPSIIEQHDENLMHSHHLEASSLIERGLDAASGNLMKSARIYSNYHSSCDPHTMFLSEHWRCVPELIHFNNHYVYEKKLIAKRESNRGNMIPFKPWSFAHIPGKSTVPKGGSRINSYEATAIADWLIYNIPIFSAHYKDQGKPFSIGESVAIISPFAKQAQLIREELLKAYQTSSSEIRSLVSVIDLKEIYVGTVHSMQGEERDFVLFSPVYTQHDKNGFFFDQGKNMLNVATSRARDAFITFGDMAIFDPEKDTPSGNIARYLFADNSNELLDVKLPSRVTDNAITAQCERLQTHKQHQTLLIEALEKAQQRIIIVSGFLTYDAIIADDIPQKLAKAITRGTKCYILYGAPTSNGITSAQKAHALFEELNIPLYQVKNIHHKTLAYDNECYMDGSYNWLSAIRDSSSRFFNREGSIVVRGASAKTWIDDTETEILKLIKN